MKENNLADNVTNNVNFNLDQISINANLEPEVLQGPTPSPVPQIETLAIVKTDYNPHLNQMIANILNPFDQEQNNTNAPEIFQHAASMLIILGFYLYWFNDNNNCG